MVDPLCSISRKYLDPILLGNVQVVRSPGLPPQPPGPGALDAALPNSAGRCLERAVPAGCGGRGLQGLLGLRWVRTRLRMARVVDISMVSVG